MDGEFVIVRVFGYECERVFDFELLVRDIMIFFIRVVNIMLLVVIIAFVGGIDNIFEILLVRVKKKIVWVIIKFLMRKI